MEYRKFNKLSWQPSLLGMGCMRLPLQTNGQIDEKETAILVQEALAGGVTYFDTAWPYHGGESERVMGNILKNYPRSSFTITTKLPSWLIETPQDIEKYFHLQLQKLQMEYVDVYLLHALDKKRYDHLKSLDVFTHLDKLKAEGKIKHLGFSFHGSLEDFLYILNDGLKHFEICQIQLNYMDISHQQGLIGYHELVKYDIPIIIMEPVKGGNLAKLPADIEKPLLKYQPDKSIASWAMRWLFSYKGICTILSGMSNLSQVKDNLLTFNSAKPLNQQENALIEEVRNQVIKRTFVACTGCQYCMPCPMEVKIKNIFEQYNKMYTYDNFKKEGLNLITKEGLINNCINCGVCLSKCPQSINIPQKLAEIKNNLTKI
ncbi:MAG: aldo/keto reductase [Acholeplasmatales bacterium]|jgi:predicted aldo/keto reductase-like oxidoreductase|nr:aldo/keto reductase [Acholeplasmatales bacterium]